MRRFWSRSIRFYPSDLPLLFPSFPSVYFELKFRGKAFPPPRRPLSSDDGHLEDIILLLPYTFTEEINIRSNLDTLFLLILTFKSLFTSYLIRSTTHFRGNGYRGCTDHADDAWFTRVRLRCIAVVLTQKDRVFVFQSLCNGMLALRRNPSSSPSIFTTKSRAPTNGSRFQSKNFLCPFKIFNNKTNNNQKEKNLYV